MTEFYELLAKMGYYDSALIQRPIHLLGINVTLALELGYSQKAIQVMQMLPYLGIQDENNKYELGWGDEFLLNGGFTDLRTDEALSQCRDPFYLLDEDEEENKLGWDDPGGKYMKPDYICLSELANHGTVMILNVKNYRLWTIDQETGNSDPTVKDNDWTVSKNENSLDNFASRPARDALKSYMQKFISLEWMPPEWPGSYEGDNYARLYIENGWPDNFNLSAFNISRLQWHEDEFRRRRAEEPFEQVQKLESGLNHNSELEVIYLRVIQDVSAGLGLPRTAPTNPDGTVVDRVTYRQGVMKTLDEIREGILALEKKLTAAREVVKLVDPAVAQARKERKVKYGQLS